MTTFHEQDGLNCVIQAWDKHETELRYFLLHQLGDHDIAEDLLQDTFLKAIAEGSRFCQLDAPRAWLFRVTRNRLIDYRRTCRPTDPVADELPDNTEPIAAVATLTQCLPRALSELSPEDGEAIHLCDLEGMTQAAYAERLGISLAGAKSRIQRARKRLREHLKVACQVRFDESGKVCCFVPRGTPEK